MDVRIWGRRATALWRRAPRWQKGSSIALAVMILLVIIDAVAGGGSGSSNRTASPSPGTVEPSPATDLPGEAIASNPSAAPSSTAPTRIDETSMSAAAAAHSTPPPPVAAASAVTGFGATDTNWNSAHTEDTEFAPGAVYDTDPSLPEINGHTGAKYTAVLHTAGHVISYTLNLPTGTDLTEAMARTESDLPSDATAVWEAAKDTCSQMEFRSSTLGTALGDPSIGDEAGDVFVEFTTGDGYDPSDVTNVLVGLGDYPTAQDAPAC